MAQTQFDRQFEEGLGRAGASLSAGIDRLSRALRFIIFETARNPRLRWVAIVGLVVALPLSKWVLEPDYGIKHPTGALVVLGALLVVLALLTAPIAAARRKREASIKGTIYETFRVRTPEEQAANPVQFVWRGRQLQAIRSRIPAALEHQHTGAFERRFSARIPPPAGSEWAYRWDLYGDVVEITSRAKLPEHEAQIRNLLVSVIGDSAETREEVDVLFTYHGVDDTETWTANAASSSKRTVEPAPEGIQRALGGLVNLTITGLQFTSIEQRLDFQKVMLERVETPEGLTWAFTDDPFKGTLRVWLERMLERLIPFEPAMFELAEREGGLLVGYDKNMNAQIWKPEDTPHMVVSGTTGSGKSVAVRLLQIGTLHNGWDLWAADPKMVEFKGLAGREGIRTGIADSDSTAPVWNLINDAAALMRERYDRIKNDGGSAVNLTEYREHLTARGVPAEDLPRRLLVFVDELAIVLSQPKGIDKKSEEGAELLAIYAQAVKSFDDILTLGRAAGVHLVGAIQRPDADVLGGRNRDNLGGRLLLGGKIGASAAAMMDVNAPVPAYALSQPKGLGRFRQEGEAPICLRVPFVPTRELADLLDVYAPPVGSRGAQQASERPPRETHPAGERAPAPLAVDAVGDVGEDPTAAELDEEPAVVASTPSEAPAPAGPVDPFARRSSNGTGGARRKPDLFGGMDLPDGKRKR